VFRDNFDTIKQSLRTAKNEITDLQDNSARIDESSDFNKNELRNLVLGKASVQLQDYGTPITNSTQEINFSQGIHHILRVGASMNLEFVGFPGDSNIAAADLLSGMGKITLELYGDGTIRTLTFNQPNGTVVKTANFPSSLLTIESSTDPVLLEVYRYSSAFIFIRYLGQFA
jgi:hypothetical protein